MSKWNCTASAAEIGNEEHEVLKIRVLADRGVGRSNVRLAILLNEFAYVDGQSLAALLSIPYKSIMELVSADQIPHHRIGKRVRFSLSEINRWIASGKAERSEILTKNEEGQWQL